MTDRKLASIQEIKNINTIEGADRIVTAEVLGWQVVTKKDDFENGDKCVFFEIDSILPNDNPAFEFLGDKKRLKTIRLKKQLSQGLAMPLEVAFSTPGWPSEYEIGDDVTEHLGVVKHDPMANQPFYKGLAKSRIRTFPSFIPKTDEQRMQSYPELLDEINEIPVYITTKLDGTSMTVYHFEGEYGICSRQMMLKTDDGNIYAEVADKLALEEILTHIGNYAIQGELVGPKIQGNKLGLTERQFFAFNVFDIDEHKYLDYDDFIEFCRMIGVTTVPINYANVLLNNFTLESILVSAKGDYNLFGFNNSTWPREGIVIRPMVETVSKILRSRLSFKVINNDFLEKGGS